MTIYKLKMKKPLSIEGEEKAKKMSDLEELKNIDVIYSSNYVRAISTAKYIAYNNNLDIIINENFGERKFGVDSYDEINLEFYERQYNDENYKKNNGESSKEVRLRMYSALMDVISKNKNKKIVIISHATAISFLLKTWCKLKLVDPENKIRSFSFKNKVIFNKIFEAPEIFKLMFDDENSIISIENINYL